MENYSYSSYPDSRDSSPRSREIECENPSWEEPLSNAASNAVTSNSGCNNYRVKFMCSYGGKIQPRNHDNQLAYIGGETKILAVERSINFSGISSKLSSLCDATVCFKYQLPGEDLDALISVTNDEDLEHMMLEYDRLYRASAKPARMRLFLFPLNPSGPTSFGSNESKSERQWFVDALNSVQIQPIGGSSPPEAAVNPNANPDFLFGLDKGYPPVPPSKLTDSEPSQTVPDMAVKDTRAGSDYGSEDRHVIGEPVDSPSEMQRQIHELQRLQITSQEQAAFHRKSDEANSRAYTADYYSQKMQEKTAPAPAAVSVPVPMPLQASYFPERHMISAGYPMAGTTTPTGADQHIYLIPTASGLYQAQTIRQLAGPINHAYYGMQRVIPDGYNSVPQQQASFQQRPNVGAFTTEGLQLMQPKVGMAEGGYAQVGYDSSGRQVYYTAAPGGVVPSYQTVAPVAVDGRQSGVTLNQEGKVVAKVSQASNA